MEVSPLHQSLATAEQADVSGEVFVPKETCLAEIGCSIATLNRLFARKVLPRVKLGAKTLTTRSALNRLKASMIEAAQ